MSQWSKALLHCIRFSLDLLSSLSSSGFGIYISFLFLRFSVSNLFCRFLSRASMQYECPYGVGMCVLFPFLGQDFKASSFSLSSILFKVKGSALRNHWSCLFPYPELRLRMYVNHQVSCTFDFESELFLLSI